MKLSALICMLALIIPAQLTAAELKKRSIDSAEAQLQEAYALLFQIQKLHTPAHLHTKIMDRMLEIGTERQALRILRTYHSSSQPPLLDRLIHLYQTGSAHPLLKAAQELQQTMKS